MICLQMAQFALLGSDSARHGRIMQHFGEAVDARYQTDVQRAMRLEPNAVLDVAYDIVCAEIEDHAAKDKKLTLRQVTQGCVKRAKKQLRQTSASGTSEGLGELEGIASVEVWEHVVVAGLAQRYFAEEFHHTAYASNSYIGLGSRTGCNTGKGRLWPVHWRIVEDTENAGHEGGAAARSEGGAAGKSAHPRQRDGGAAEAARSQPKGTGSLGSSRSKEQGRSTLRATSDGAKKRKWSVAGQAAAVSADNSSTAIDVKHPTAHSTVAEAKSLPRHAIVDLCEEHELSSSGSDFE